MSILTKNFFLWPYQTDSLQPAIDELTPFFAKSGLAAFCNDNMPQGNLVEFVALLCRQHNISPWWVVVSGQREQGVFSKADLPLSASVAWLGFVGQDVGRAVRPGYYGIYAQVARLVEQSAWLLGVEPSEAWPEYVRAGKGARRFVPGLAVMIEKDGQPVSHVCQDAGEYLCLTYTPHFQVLQTNFEIASKLAPSKYLQL